MKRIFTLMLPVLLAGLTTAVLDAAGKKENKKNKPGAGGLEREFQELLQRCDTNKDGAVSRDEFTKNQPAGKDPASATQWFEKKDTNKDGQLTHDEFVPPPNKK